MNKEKVIYTNGETHEFDVQPLGYRKVRQIINKHIPLSKIRLDKDKNPIMPDDFSNDSMLDMIEDCLSTIKGLDLDSIQASEFGRIYKKHFEQSILMGLGGKGDPNLKESWELWSHHQII